MCKSEAQEITHCKLQNTDLILRCQTRDKETHAHLNSEYRI